MGPLLLNMMRAMTTANNKRRFAKTAALLAIVLALVFVLNLANKTVPQQPDDFNASVNAAASVSTPDSSTGTGLAAGREDARTLPAGWGSADPEVYALIALAFESEPLREAVLRDVECRGQLCRVSFEAAAGLPVRQLLPIQLAQSFKAMVAVHAGEAGLVYVDIPPRD